MSDLKATERSQIQPIVNRVVAGWMQDKEQALRTLDGFIQAYEWKAMQGSGSSSWSELAECLRGVKEELRELGEAWTSSERSDLWSLVTDRIQESERIERLDAKKARVYLAVLVALFRHLPEHRHEAETYGSKVAAALTPAS